MCHTMWPAASYSSTRPAGPNETRVWSPARSWALPPRVAITPPAPTVVVAGTVQLTATTKDANGSVLTGRVVTWASGTPAVATVSATGLVTGVAQGQATITATSEGQQGTAAVTVMLAPVSSVTVTPNPATVQIGQTLQLTATLKDANQNVLTGRVVTWASDNTAVATVSSN